MEKKIDRLSPDGAARAAGILAALGVASVAELSGVTGLPAADIEAARAHYAGGKIACTTERDTQAAPAVTVQPAGVEAQPNAPHGRG